MCKDHPQRVGDNNQGPVSNSSMDNIPQHTHISNNTDNKSTHNARIDLFASA